MGFAWKVALSRVGARAGGGEIGAWAALLFAYDVAALAMTFGSPIFMSQAGLEFWLLNGCLCAAWWGQRERAGGAASAHLPAGAAA